MRASFGFLTVPETGSRNGFLNLSLDHAPGTPTPPHLHSRRGDNWHLNGDQRIVENLHQRSRVWPSGYGSKNWYQNGLPWEVEAWTKTCGLPQLLNFEPQPSFRGLVVRPKDWLIRAIFQRLVATGNPNEARCPVSLCSSRRCGFLSSTSAFAPTNNFFRF